MLKGGEMNTRERFSSNKRPETPLWAEPCRPHKQKPSRPTQGLWRLL
jgi:hypothetical protein